MISVLIASIVPGAIDRWSCTSTTWRRCFASCALLVVFWDSARVPVAVGLAALYTLGLAVAAMAFNRYLRRQPRPFAATLAELEDDRTCLRDDS